MPTSRVSGRRSPLTLRWRTMPSLLRARGGRYRRPRETSRSSTRSSRKWVNSARQGFLMTRTDADQCRATGIWPTWSMTRFEPCRRRGPFGHRAARPRDRMGPYRRARLAQRRRRHCYKCWPRDNVSGPRPPPCIELNEPFGGRRLISLQSTKAKQSIRGVFSRGAGIPNRRMCARHGRSGGPFCPTWADPPTGRRDEPGGDAHRRGLAASGGTNDADNLAAPISDGSGP